MHAGRPPSIGTRAVRDTANQFAAQLVVGLPAVGFSAWLNRLLPVEELALWPVCTSLGGIVAAVSSFGLGNTFERRVPALLATGQKEEASGLLKTGLALNLAGCLVMGSLVYVLAESVNRYLLHDTYTAATVQRIALAAFFIAWSERLSWALSGVQEFGRKATINLITGVIRTPLAVLLYIKMGGVQGIIVALTVVPLLACILSSAALVRHLTRSRAFAPPANVLRESLPFYGVSLVALASGRMNQLVIALLGGPSVLATYFVANSIAGYLEALDGFAVRSVAPKLAERGALSSSEDDKTKGFAQCTRYVFLLLVPLHLLVAAAAPGLMQLYGGHKYASASAVLVLLCVGLLAKVLGDVQKAHIQVFARPVHLFALSALQGVQVLGCMVLLIPPLGAMGAALSDNVVDASQGVASHLSLRRSMVLSYDWHALGLGLLSAAVGVAGVWALSPLWQRHASIVVVALLVGTVGCVVALAKRLKQRDADILIGLLPERFLAGRMGRAVCHGLCQLLVGGGSR